MSTPIPNLRRSSHLPLVKQRSWSPDSERDDAWTRRKDLHRNRKGRLSRCVTDDDLDELRGCIDLGFGFEIEKPSGKRLAETIPALDLYFSVVRSSSPSDSSSDASSPVGSPLSIFSPGEETEVVKTRLKHWAQAVACSMRQRC